MIIYGKKMTALASENMMEKCQNCRTINSITLTLYQKYAHVFWIPFIATGKTAETICSNCKQILERKQFTPVITQYYETLKTKAKTPLWTLSGLCLLILFIIFIVFENKQNKVENTTYIAAPQKGDIYEVKGNGHYTLYKVDQIVKDSVFVLVNQYETDKLTGLAGLKKKGDEAYTTDALMILKADLKTMLDTGEILDVDRK
jgi:hypothetical protein